jgi:hypothetical protein
MKEVVKTIMFGCLSGAAAAGLAMIYVLLAFRGDPPGGVAIVAVYGALSTGAVAAAVGAVLYVIFMRFLTLDAFSRLVALTLAVEGLVAYAWDFVGSSDSRWFGAFFVVAFVVVLVVREARRVGELRTRGE